MYNVGVCFVIRQQDLHISPGGLLGGLGLLKLMPRPGLAAGSGIDNSISESGNGRGVEVPS